MSTVPAPIRLDAALPRAAAASSTASDGAPVINLTRPAAVEKAPSGKAPSFHELLSGSSEEAGPASKPGMPFGPKPEKKHVRAYDLDPTDRMLRFVHSTKSDGSFKPFGEDGFTVGDVIDIINPLQHIPIVGTIYRWLTGDEISPAASLAGGALFGGPIGLAAAAGGVVFEEATGSDPGATLMAMATGEEQAGWTKSDQKQDAAPVLASAAAPAAAPVPASARLTADAAASRLNPLPAPLPPSATVQAAAAKPAAAPASAPVSEQPKVVSLSEDQFAALLSRGHAKPAPAAEAALTASVPAVPSSVADQMMLGLSKYDAMSRSRAAAGAKTGAMVDAGA